MNDENKIAEILKRRVYFDKHFPPIYGFNFRQDISFVLSNSCPSCGYMTLSGRCCWDTCAFCFWEDDGQDNHDAQLFSAGPNDNYSLTSHRLEMYDWMAELKNMQESNDSIETKIGSALNELDTFINNNEANRDLVTRKIELLFNLFNKKRGFENENFTQWNFVNEKESPEVKLAHDNAIPKTKRSWWQKLFSFK